MTVDNSVGTRAWRKRRKAVLLRDGYVCRWCGGEATEADHVVARAEGGTNAPGNLVAACRRCNSMRGKAVQARMRRRKGAARAIPSPAADSPLPTTVRFSLPKGPSGAGKLWDMAHSGRNGEGDA